MVRPASSPWFKAVWSLGMLPTAVKAAIGAMACCLADSVCSVLIALCSWAGVVAGLEARHSAAPMAIAKATAAVLAPNRRLTSVVLLIADFLHPLHILAVHSAGDGQMAHGGLSARRHASALHRA